jgi:hypothetical protein
LISPLSHRQMESQRHGFDMEAAILGAYGLDPVEMRTSYTRAHDIPASKNTKEPGWNVSIKATGGRSVDMGDILRIFDETAPDAQPLLLTVISYTQEGTTKKIQNIRQLTLSGTREKLFGDVTRSELEGYVAMVKAIPAGEPSAEARINYKMRADVLNGRMRALQIRPKVDSRNQRRVQCSFPDFKAFWESEEGRTVTYEGMPMEFASGRRVRRERTQNTV